MTSDRFFGPLTNLRTLIANSATFQTEVGAGDASAALASITYYSVGVPATFTRPRMFIGSAGDLSMNKVSTTGWEVGGSLEMEFQRESDSGDVGDPAAGFATFGAILDAIIDEMAALSGSNGYLDVRGFSLASDPLLWVEELNDGVEYWNAIVNVAIGGA